MYHQYSYRYHNHFFHCIGNFLNMFLRFCILSCHAHAFVPCKSFPCTRIISWSNVLPLETPLYQIALCIFLLPTQVLPRLGKDPQRIGLGIYGHRHMCKCLGLNAGLKLRDPHIDCYQSIRLCIVHLAYYSKIARLSSTQFDCLEVSPAPRTPPPWTPLHKQTHFWTDRPPDPKFCHYLSNHCIHLHSCIEFNL